MARPKNLKKLYELKLGKAVVSKLSDAQLSTLSKYYNSLSDKEKEELDEKISKGSKNDLLEIATGMIEENEADEPIPEGLDDLLSEITGNKKDKQDQKQKDENDKSPSPPSALATIPKEDNQKKTGEQQDTINDEDFVEEEIDSRILDILGIKDTFDLTYGEYKSLLRERATAAWIGDPNISTENAQLIANEFKRVKNKESDKKIKIKKKVVKVEELFKRTAGPKKQQLDPKKLLPPEKTDKKEDAALSPERNRESSLNRSLSSILSVLNDIKSILNEQLLSDSKSQESLRREYQKSGSREREGRLESKKDNSNIIKDLASKIEIPFFDRIKKYFGNIFAGSVVVGLLNWLNDPKNKKSVDNFKEFFINQGPLILGGILALTLLPVASTLLSFSAAILGGAAKLISAIPLLKAAITGLATAAAMSAVVAAGAIIPKMFPGRVNEQERKTLKTLEEKYKGNKGEMVKDLKNQKKNLNFLQVIQGVGNEIDEQISFLESGRTKMYGSTGEDLILEQLEKQGLPKDQLNYLKELYKLDKSPKGSEKLQTEADKKRAQELSSMTPEKLKELFQKGKSLDLFKAYKGGDSESVKIPGLGSIVAGTNWFGGRQRKYFDENGKEISEEEMNQKYRLYSAVLEKRKKDKQKEKPQTPSGGGMPGLPPSAAQPGTGPTGNLVGSSSIPNQAGLPPLPPTNTLPGKQHYGASRDNGTRKHAGVDFDISGNEKFYSRIGGVVVSNPFRYGADGWGIDIYNQQLGVYERIAEAAKVLVKKGQTVSPGQAVVQGESETGVIHYEIRKKIEGGYEGTLDPMAFLGNPTRQNGTPPSGQIAGISPSQAAPSITPFFSSPLIITGPSKPQAQSVNPPGGGSSSSAKQAPVPSFSSEDPNNFTTMVVKGIYNVVG
jgi:membrane protein implicated in regulation of membrane protease activity